METGDDIDNAGAVIVTIVLGLATLALIIFGVAWMVWGLFSAIIEMVWTLLL